MAPIWPAGHAIIDADGVLLGGITVFRRTDQGPFTDDETSLANRFVPRIRHAAIVHPSPRGRSRSARPSTASIPACFCSTDSAGSFCKTRPPAAFLQMKTGFEWIAAAPSAQDAKDNVRLQEPSPGRLWKSLPPPDTPNVLRIQRPSGKREYTLTVGALLETTDEASEDDAHRGDLRRRPGEQSLAPAEVLEDLYDLTHSEAQIVRLIADGLSLEEAAKKRGVSLNTARSHLKRAFVKTGTTRQSELLRLLVAGIGSIGSDDH